MPESRKTSTSHVNSKEKSSLPANSQLVGKYELAYNVFHPYADIDFGKDFLGSWQSDKGMDFDFGPTTEGKGKAFKFDKMDIDFSLDDDFGKISSFKMDMSDLDISSPLKKSGKTKEGSKNVSSGGEKASKRDSFAFPFDFDEFADLDFDLKKTKTDEKCNKSKDKEGNSNMVGSGDSGDLFGKDVDASESDDISSKHLGSQDVSISKVDTKMDSIKDSDPRNEDKRLSSTIDGMDSIWDSDPRSEDKHLKTTIDKVDSIKDSDPRNEDKHSKSTTDEMDSIRHSDPPNEDKNLKSTIENSQGKEIQRTSPPEEIISCSVEEPIQESHPSEKRSSPEPHALQVVQDVHDHSLAGNVSTQEEECTMVVEMEKNNTVMCVAEMVPTQISSFENLLETMNSQSQKGEVSKTMECNVLIGHIDGDDTSISDSHLERSVKPGIKNLSHGEFINKRNADSSLKVHTGFLESGTSADELVSEKESGNIPNRSKYFKIQSGSKSELQKIRINTLPNNPALEEREFSSKLVESGSKFTCISKSPHKVQSNDMPVQMENTKTGHLKSLDDARKCLNAEVINPRNEPVMTKVAHDIGLTKEKPESRSDVHPSSSIEMSKKDLKKNSLNPGVQVSRVSEPKLKSLNSLLTKGLTSIRNKEQGLELQGNMALNSLLTKDLTSIRNKKQGLELQGNMAFKRNPFVDTKKQALSTLTLKRKAFEESAETPRLKRLSPSPRSNNIRASAERVIEKQVCSPTTVADEINVSVTQVDISSAIENDDIVEKAEACSKELDDMCNMLKKKHEEAKNLLVRAIVNNNNLLMLNHPIHQDKLGMVQKFAALLISKSEST